MTSPRPGRVVFLRSNGIDPDPRVEKEARALHLAGWEVTIFAWDRMGTLPPDDERAYASVHRICLPARFTSFATRLVHMCRWQLALFRRLLRERHKYSHIHACDLDTILPALLIKRLFGKKVVYDMFDLYADMLRDGPPAFRRLIKKIEFWAVGRADALILVDDCRRKQIEGAKPHSLCIVYNSPEKTNLPEEPSTRPADALRVAYIGLLHVDRGILEMLQLMKKHPEWSMDLGGSGTDEDIIIAATRKSPNVTFHGQIDYERAIELYARADVLFATYDPAILNHRYSSANKLFEAMMLGKPIIVAKDTGMDSIVGKYSLGEVVDYGDRSQLEAALNRIAALGYDERQALSDRAKQVYEQEFNWDRMRERVVSLYDSLAKGMDCQ